MSRWMRDTRDVNRVCAIPGCHRTSAGRHCPEHRVNLHRSVYNRRWRTQLRPYVLDRDGYRCRYCGERAHPGKPLDVAHLDQTTRLAREGADVHDANRLVTAHRACHAANAPHLTPA